MRHRAPKNNSLNVPEKIEQKKNINVRLYESKITSSGKEESKIEGTSKDAKEESNNHGKIRWKKNSARKIQRNLAESWNRRSLFFQNVRLRPWALLIRLEKFWLQFQFPISVKEIF
jgi:hypothetical protein